MKNFNYGDLNVTVHLLDVRFSLHRIAEEKLTGQQEVEIDRLRELNEKKIAEYLKENSILPDKGDSILSIEGLDLWHRVTSISLLPRYGEVIIRCGEDPDEEEKDDIECGILYYFDDNKEED